MKVAILTGDHGIHRGEETSIRPNPMGESSGKSIIWHIMKIYFEKENQHHHTVLHDIKYI